MVSITFLKCFKLKLLILNLSYVVDLILAPFQIYHHVPNLEISLFVSLTMNVQWLEDFFRLPVLESLMLDNCNELRQVKICSQPLKHIIFKVFTIICDESDVTIDSPNLVSFRFEGCPLSKILMNFKALVEANVTLSPVGLRDPYLPVVYDTSWYAIEEALIFPDELHRVHNALLPTVKHLKVTTRKPLLRKSDL